MYNLFELNWVSILVDICRVVQPDLMSNNMRLSCHEMVMGESVVMGESEDVRDVISVQTGKMLY